MALQYKVVGADTEGCGRRAMAYLAMLRDKADDVIIHMTLSVQHDCCVILFDCAQHLLSFLQLPISFQTCCLLHVELLQGKATESNPWKLDKQIPCYIAAVCSTAGH